jgi:hypothetical protein
MHRLLLLAAIPGLATACGHVGAPPHPLYAGPTRPANELAMLSGPVAKVDGIDVSHLGALFSLAPGCHVVELQSSIGEGGVSGAWSADIPSHVYAFRMLAGRSYVIDLRLLPGNHGVGTANVGSVKIKAIEQDSQGNKLGNLTPVHGHADITACEEWAAGIEAESQALPPEKSAAKAEAGRQPAEPAPEPKAEPAPEPKAEPAPVPEPEPTPVPDPSIQ